MSQSAYFLVNLFQIVQKRSPTNILSDQRKAHEHNHAVRECTLCDYIDMRMNGYAPVIAA